jgi:hypothetical protein
LEFKSLGEKSYEIKPEELTGGSLILVLKRKSGAFHCSKNEGKKNNYEVMDRHIDKCKVTVEKPSISDLWDL